MSKRKLPKANWLLVTGIVLILLGIGAILAPAIAGSAVVYIIGSLLLVTGLIQFFAGWNEDSVKSKLLQLIQAAIVGIAGIAVLAHPFYGLAALSLVLAIFFVIDGVWKISLSFSYRAGSGWLALLASGVIAVLLPHQSQHANWETYGAYPLR
jgi:membrane protein HdeD